MFDLNQNPAQCETYFSQYLKGRVEFVHAERLAQSSRDAPWKVDLQVDGIPRSYVLRLGMRNLKYEYRILRTLMPLGIPTPRAYGWDPDGIAFGVKCFFHDFIQGESLLKPMVAGETWAEDLYLDAVSTLQNVTEKDLGTVASHVRRESAIDEVEVINAYFQDHPHPITDEVYKMLKVSMPRFPKMRFSNGDFWLENFIVRDQKLAGIIDFENACFSDPVYEFLFPFFIRSELRGRGIEERFCARLGVDPAILHWYHGLEYFETLHWVLRTRHPFEGHTVENLEANLLQWLDEVM